MCYIVCERHKHFGGLLHRILVTRRTNSNGFSNWSLSNIQCAIDYSLSRFKNDKWNERNWQTMFLLRVGRTSHSNWNSRPFTSPWNMRSLPYISIWLMYHELCRSTYIMCLLELVILESHLIFSTCFLYSQKHTDSDKRTMLIWKRFTHGFLSIPCTSYAALVWIRRN